MRGNGSRRVLAATGSMLGRPLDWSLGVVAEAGYDGAEVMVGHDRATQDPGRLAETATREGIAVPVVHGPFLLMTRRVFGTDPVAKARRALDLAAAVGADVVVVHPPYRWQTAFHRWLLRDCPGEARERGIEVGVENLFPVVVSGRELRFHRGTAPEQLLPYDRVVFDTSHFGVVEADLDRAWQLLRARVAHVHVSDNRGEGRDSHAPLGHGVLPLARFLRRVAAEPGPSVTLEVDCRPHLGDRATLVAYLTQEREKCQALMDGAAAEDVLGRPDTVAAPPRTHSAVPQPPSPADARPSPDRR